MQLSNAQLNLFRHDGCISFEEFFTPRETRALQIELERMYDVELKSETSINCAVQEDGTQRDNYGERQNLQVIPLNNRSDLHKALAFNPKVLSVVEQLIGDDFRLELDQAFWKPPKVGIGTNWHQDNAYFKIADPLRGTAMWIAIHDANVENGCLHVIPGSHRETYDHYRDSLSDHHIRCDPPEHRAVPVELKAGGVVFFCYGVAHCTKTNHSNADRAGVALHFLHNHFGGLDTWEMDKTTRPMLRGPLATGGAEEFGERFEGRWEELVEQVLATGKES